MANGSSLVKFARTADTTPYLAGDVIGNAATAVWLFDKLASPNGGESIITTSRFEIDLTGVILGMGNFRLHFYSITPPSALADNAPWDLPAGDRDSYRGYIDLGTPVDIGSTLYVETVHQDKQITIPYGGIYTYLQTIGAYTPSSADQFRIHLYAMGL